VGTGAGGFAHAPDGGRRGASFRLLAGRPATVTLGVVSAVVVATYLIGSGPLQQAMLMVSSTVAVLAVGGGVWLNRLSERRPWTLAAAGLTMLTAVNAWWYLYGMVPGVRPTGLTDTFQIVGYLAMLGAIGMVVVRHAPHDGGSIIDAAVVGLAVAAPLWEFLVRPRMLDAGSGAGHQVVILVELLVLLGILGALERVSRTSLRGQTSLWLLFTSLAGAVAGVVVLDAPDGGGGFSASVLCYIVGYLSLGAAALHPSAKSLLRPVESGQRGMSRLPAGLLGGSMVLVPVVGGIPQLFGAPADGLLLTIAPLIMVPLVLTRISQLIGQRARDQRELAYQATHDDLTGLVNRRHLFAVVAQASAGRPDRPAAVLYCDLDDFKPINDRYGHKAGDEVLRCVARRLVSSLRDQDVVARIGGDEFLAYCPDADVATGELLRRRVEEALRAPIGWDGVELYVAVTVGTAYDDGRYPGPDELFAAADQVMYERKRARKQTRPAGAVPSLRTVPGAGHNVPV
jgi:diguanylate cyclase (GGDEF)-like protein